MKKIVLSLLFMLTLLFAVLLINTFNFSSRQFKVPPEKNVNIEDQAIDRLSEAVRYKTISHDERNNFDSASFQGLNDYMEKMFPLCHERMEKQVINGFSLVYKWTGKDPLQKPILLLAHLDVVPAEGAWEEDPFSGVVKNGYIWGRGTLDDKVSVLGILEAAELLLKENFKPERSIYFAFGHDEEVHGRTGAHNIGEWMKENKIEFEYLLDEGLVITEGLVPGIEKPVALVGIAEKGNVIMKLSVNLKSGHASMPEKETAIGVLSAGIQKIQSNPFGPTLTEPVQKLMEYIGPEMGFFKRIVFANTWLFKPFIVKTYEMSPSGNASVRTTVAPAVFNAGVKENIVPDYAEAILNIRPLPGHSPEQIIKDIAAILRDERIAIQLLTAIPPSAISDTEAKGYKTIDKTIRQVFPDAIVAPSLMVAGTDSKHYAHLTQNLYRFLPVRFKKEDLTRIHGKNERISTEAYKNVIRFYYTLIRNIH